MCGVTIPRKVGGTNNPPSLEPYIRKWEFVKFLFRVIWLLLTIKMKLKRYDNCTPLQEKGKQEFILDTFKPLVLGIGSLIFPLIPDPATVKYNRSRNTEKWIELRDWYFEHERLEKVRTEPFRVIFNLVILLQEYNSCYSQRLNAIRKKWGEMEWDSEMPQRWWKE